MSALHPVFAIGTLAMAVLTAAALAYISPVPAAKRYGSLDGLRGVLAVFVMISHAANWRLYAMTGEWTLPPSRLYSHFGQTSVALFFMVTAFLFGSKLLDARGGAVDWLRLYVSRALRLIPLYVVFVVLLVVAALTSSRFVLRESVPRFGLNVVHWLAFTMFDMPAVNRLGVPMIGGQAWSLPYEWWFYLALPVMAILAGRRRQPLGVVVVSAVATGAAALWITSRNGWPNAIMFVDGWVAAVLMRRAWAQRAAAGPWSSIAAIVVLAGVTRTQATVDFRSAILLSIPFLAIAGGNTLFGVLTSAPLRVLGEMSYSLYLLHGIGLYVVFSTIGSAAAAKLSPVQHWLVVLAATPVIIILCRLTYRTIEAPAMAAVDTATARARSLFGRRRAEGTSDDTLIAAADAGSAAQRG